MKKYTLLFFLLILMSGCSKTSAKILPNSTSTVIASTEAIYTASNTTTPHQPTVTPFPPLGFIPSGKLAFVVGGDIEELHIANGIGEDISVISPPYNIYEISHPVWSPNNEYITFNCSCKIRTMSSTDSGACRPLIPEQIVHYFGQPRMGGRHQMGS
ncbi:MAG: hypothetical protein HN855_01595 [Anaerolineae bacterium]|nr:hypothetical protein [Anaerolineae bacterium]MBT7323834.1 hypothetical protein [Anaerolineae bacterium]